MLLEINASLEEVIIATGGNVISAEKKEEEEVGVVGVTQISLEVPV